uniref:Cytochrome P450 n=1 Tax=Kalanchoe fedtschenkoi TaxID=63787 RepID=A0A7N0US72_KALFE
MQLLLQILSAVLAIILSKLIHNFIWVPRKIQLHFLKQGITGPGYHPVISNTSEIISLISKSLSKPIPLNHDILQRAIPFYHLWSGMYGKTFVYWFGSTPRLAVSDPGLVKEVLTNSSGAFEKIGLNPSAQLLIGGGLVALNGDKWALHRRIANQAFKSYFAWVPEAVASTEKMLERWEIERGGREEFELEVSREFHTLTADIISRTAFGNSFEDGKTIFENQEKLIALTNIALRSVYIPTFRYWPTAKNRERWRLNKEIIQSTKKLIEVDCDKGYWKNLLSLLRSPHKNQEGKEEMLGITDIINECKTFYNAGKETSGNFLSWAILCLAMHQDWQGMAREEIARVCKGKKAPTAEDLNDLKLVALIINKTLRLYPPVVMITRNVVKNIKLRSIDIPAGTQVYLPMTAVHHDPEIWGEDAQNFNPWRFNEPRKHLGAFFPFGLGPRICVGQNLALVEAKLALAMIIKHYSFEVSPTYRHAPMQHLTLQPQHGVQIILRRIAD